jgi:hypothetical protein
MNLSNRIGIFGTSGMAREAGDIAWASGLEPVYVAHNESELQAWNFPEPVILEKEIERYADMPFVIGIGQNNIRKAIAVRFQGLLQFSNLIHPSATFGRGQRKVLDSCKGSIVAAGARLTSGIVIGDFSSSTRTSPLPMTVFWAVMFMWRLAQTCQAMCI